MVRGYLETSLRVGVWPDSIQVSGGTLSSWLPVSFFERGSFMVCGLAGRRGEAWLKRGLPSS